MLYLHHIIEKVHKIVKYNFLLTVVLLICGFVSFGADVIDTETQVVSTILAMENENAERRFYRAEERVMSGNDLEVKIRLLDNVMRVFCDNIKTKDTDVGYRLMAKVHIDLALCLYEQQDFESEHFQYDSALLCVEVTPGPSYEKAIVYRFYADVQIRDGSIEKGHEYYWKAIAVFEQLAGYEAEQSLCYYQLATGYYQKSDTAGIANVFGKMKKLLSTVSNPKVAYDCYSVGSVYYVMLGQQHPDNESYRDSVALYNLKSIQVIENMTVDEMRKAQIKPVWNYYNNALFYDPDDGEPQIDSIEKYLDKAEEAVARCGYHGWERDECFISINDERAWLYYYKGDMAMAESTMLGVVQLLDTVDKYSPNTVLIEREQAYQFLSDLYEENGNLDKALQYQRLKADVSAKRYNVETENAMKHLMVKYDVEKKQNEIQHLKTEKKAALRALWLTAGVLLLCLVLIFIILEVFRLRKMNMDIQMYEKELEKEIIEQELSYQVRQKAILTEEYERVKGLVSKTEEDAGKYKAILCDIQRQLTESHTKTLINNMVTQIRNSKEIKEKVKQGYYTILNGLDTDEIDKLFSSAVSKLTSLDMKYILCFMAGMETEHIAELFSISIDSVYSVRHRIRKKFAKNSSIPF